ncbi:DUF4400 domain-containing protein [Alcanivorax sp.]|uniref:DUF4400 domain-containing protein n=1 Tax=Alcanivorax sp. TaxID=1872427 RepID=UPI00258FF352|nr:DUF4400 domain-containing protein [Alcanivorax sp.]
MPKSNNRGGKGYLWFLAALFLTEIGIVFLVAPNSWVSRCFSWDRGFVYQWFGQGFEQDVLHQAASWYDALFEKTGIKQASYDFLINDWNNDGLQIDDRGLSAWAAERLKTTWLAISLACYRFSQIWAWLVLLLPLLFGMVVDALTQREINKWRFFSPSALVHYSTHMAIGALASLLLLVPFLPLPMYAPAIPGGMVIVGAIGWVSIGNLGKRL